MAHTADMIDPHLRLTAKGRVLTPTSFSKVPGYRETEAGYEVDVSKPLNLRWTWIPQPHAACKLTAALFDAQGSKLDSLTRQFTAGERVKAWESSLRLDVAEVATMEVDCTETVSGKISPCVFFYAITAAVPSASTSAATSEPSFRLSSAPGREHHHPTDTSLPDHDAPLPAPTPGGEGAFLKPSANDKPQGTFAKCLQIGRPALPKPTPGRDGEVFLDNKAKNEEQQAFVRRLKGDLTGPATSISPESEAAVPMVIDEPDEPEKGTESQDRESSSREASIEEFCQCDECNDGRAEEEVAVVPSTMDDEDDDGDEVKAESDEDEGSPQVESETSMPDSVRSESAKNLVQLADVLAPILRDGMSAHATDEPLARLRTLLPQHADLSNEAFLDVLAYSSLDKLALLAQKAGNRVPSMALGKRKRTASHEGSHHSAGANEAPGDAELDDRPLRELALTPLIKRLQRAHPNRAEQFAQAKPLLAAQQIAGDVIGALGLTGLHKAGVTLGVAAAIVEEVTRD